MDETKQTKKSEIIFTNIMNSFEMKICRLYANKIELRNLLELISFLEMTVRASELNEQLVRNGGIQFFPSVVSLNEWPVFMLQKGLV